MTNPDHHPHVHRRADVPSALDCGSPLPLSTDPPKSSIVNRKSRLCWSLLLGASLVLGYWLLLIPASPSPSFPSLSFVKDSAFLAQLSTPSASTFGAWLACAVAALSILVLGKQFMRKTPIEAEFLTKKEFNEFRDKVDTSFNSLRDRIDHSHETLANKLDTINGRLSDVSSLVARLDERTKDFNRSTINPQPSTKGNHV